MGDNPYKYCNLQWEIIHTLLSCDNSIDELLIRLGAVNPQNTNIVTVNKIVNDCNNILSLPQIRRVCLCT